MVSHLSLEQLNQFVSTAVTRACYRVRSAFHTFSKARNVR